MKILKEFIKKIDSVDVVLITAFCLYSEILFVTLLKTIQ